jgi:co-chaperonin GroES (HSP10)
MEKKSYSAAKPGDEPDNIRNLASDESRQALVNEKGDVISKIAAKEKPDVELVNIIDNSTIELPQTTLEPLEDRVIIFPDKAADKIGSIIVPDHLLEKNTPNRGRVVAAGPGLHSRYTGELIEMTLHRGDTVMYGQYAGLNITDPVSGKKYLVMRRSDVFIRVSRG